MISFNKIITLTTVTLFVTACTSAPKPYQATTWYKEGITKNVTNDKIGHCKIEVGASNLSKEQALKLVSYCMQADGYRLVTETRYR